MQKYLTFDDVLLLPQYSEVIPTQTSTTTKLTNNITLNLPLLSAAMDTVTEHEMAISMALNGGLGIIHKNLSIDKQVLEVQKVKNFNLISSKNPITCQINDSFETINDLLVGYHISSIIICKEENPIGIITKKDLKYLTEKNFNLEDFIATKELVTCFEDTPISEIREKMFDYQITKIVVTDKNNKLISIVTMSDLDQYEKYSNAVYNNKGTLLVGAAVSTSEDVEKRIEALVNAGIDMLVIDSAHANSKNVISIVASTRNKYPLLDIMAGNVVTADAITNLAKAGANVVKVGIGSGSICTTRIVSAVGAPQLSALLECITVAKENNVTLVSDGGTRYSGDIVKALAAGAKAVMLGSMLAGHKESPGELIISNSKKYKSYIGMGSVAAMNRGSSDRYFQNKHKKFVPEGVEALISYKGHIDDTLYQIKGGIHSALGYNGAKNLCELEQKAIFIEISNSSKLESHPHSLDQVNDSPNYK